MCIQKQQTLKKLKAKVYFLSRQQQILSRGNFVFIHYVTIREQGYSRQFLQSSMWMTRSQRKGSPFTGVREEIPTAVCIGKRVPDIAPGN